MNSLVSLAAHFKSLELWGETTVHSIARHLRVVSRYRRVRRDQFEGRLWGGVTRAQSWKMSRIFCAYIKLDCVSRTVLERGPQGEISYDLSWQSGRVEMDRAVSCSLVQGMANYSLWSTTSPAPELRMIFTKQRGMGVWSPSTVLFCFCLFCFWLFMP